MDLVPELNQYMNSIRKKRNRQYLDDTLLAIMLNKNEDEDLIEAIEKANITSKTKKELIEWLNIAGIKKGDYK